MKERFNIVIVGAKGYVGQELVKLVIAHPMLNLYGVGVRLAQAEVVAAIPNLSLAEIKEQAATIDIVLLATPPKVSMEYVGALAAEDITLIDLSGAFRLPEEEFAKWYDLTHDLPELLQTAQYGLSPWAVKKPMSQLLANPGCYATCALMALIPLVKEKVVTANNNIIIDAKSGVSGAGKKINANLMFGEIENNFFPYKIGKHQHTPEINNALEKFSGQQSSVTLITQMLPVMRGMAMTIYADAGDHFASDAAISAAIESAFHQAYHDYPLATYQEINDKHNANNLGIKHVINTPKIHIGYFVKNAKVMLFVCIDNLLKGAASQAIENINAICHLPLHTGLFSVGGAA